MQNTSGLSIYAPFLRLTPFTPLKQAIAQMVGTGLSCVLIMEEQVLLGIFTERDVVHLTTNRQLDLSQPISAVMTTNVITLDLSDTTDLLTLLPLFQKHKVSHLPILNAQKHVVGVLTPSSLRTLLKPEYLLRHIRVSEVMNRSVITGLPTDSIRTLAQQMTSYDVSCIVITNSSNSTPLGIVTESDIVHCHQLGLDFEKVCAQKITTKALVSINFQESLWCAHKRMQDFNVRRLIVTKASGELAGIVTQSQLFQKLDTIETSNVVQLMQEVIERKVNELRQLNQELQNRNQELTNLSIIDELTQVTNRRGLDEFLQIEWQRLIRFGNPLSVIMCDVDYFKAYNDTYGHLAGDDCLIKIAQGLRSVTRRNSDLVARYGGEEFVVVLPNTEVSGAERVAHAILSAIQNLAIPHRSSSVANHVTVSLGVSTALSHTNHSHNILLHVADQLLYQSKARGRNTYSLQLLSHCSPIA